MFQLLILEIYVVTYAIFKLLEFGWFLQLNCWNLIRLFKLLEFDWFIN